MEFASNLINGQMQSISIEGFKNTIRDYCSSRQLGISQQLIYDIIKERGDIIVVSESLNIVQFKHRSFAEFLYAKRLIRSQEYSVDQTALDPYWSNIHFFSFGILKDAPSQLKRLYNPETTKETDRFFKCIYTADYLMAAYQTPYAIIQEGVEKAANDFGRLYIDIVKKDSNLFDNLPKMALLYIFQMMFRASYGYDFLKNAIDSAGLNIAADRIEHFPYSLFFLDAALVEENRDGNFKILMDACGDSIPIEISLAVRHETHKDKITYSGVKRNNKRALRILKDTGSKNAILKLYGIPVKDIASGSPKR